VKSIPTESERRRALRGLRIYFAQRRWPRVMMSSLVGLSGAAGFFASFGMLRLGVNAMWLRYPLAVLAAWAAFLALMRVWAEFERRCFLPDTELDELLHLPDPGEPTERMPDDSPKSRGGPDSSWWDWLEIPDLDAEGCLPTLVIGVVAVLLGSAFVGVLEIVSMAPALMAEVFLDSVLVAVFYRRMKKIQQRWWLGGAISQTWKPVLLTALALMVTGWALRKLVPGANSIGGVWWHYYPPSLEQ
jgi:hypothetical protein